MGEKQFKQIAQGLTLSQAEGPGGRWYWEQVRFPGTGGTKATCFTTIWSPEAGYNPVVQFSSEEQPDGKLGDKTEWQWKLFNDTYVPATFKLIAYHGEPDGSLNLQQDATLEDCVVNKPLDPHQFDYEGLGLKDGDEVMDIPNSDEVQVYSQEREASEVQELRPVGKYPGAGPAASTAPRSGRSSPAA